MIAVDLFAGAGGFTEGARLAGVPVAWAANHWKAAVTTHAANHPTTRHACQDLHQVDWSTVPAHDLLLASPCCHGHSPARGKDRPQHDASRSTAWAVVSCAEYHRPEAVIVENVPAFQTWTLYPAWCAAMTALGYTLAPHTLDAADHGVPQHRVRLFIVATRSRHPIALDLPQRPHVPLLNILDPSADTWSPIAKPGRSPATLRRIANGRRLFGDHFVVPYYGNGSGLTGRSLTRPVGTITTRARWALVEGDRMRMLSVAESRRAMGFRESYALPSTQREAMIMLGNAVPPPAAADVINALRRAL